MMSGSTTDTVRTISGGETVSEAVVNAVADAKGVDPLDLDPLYDTIAPDALDRLFGDYPGSGSAELRFELSRCEVVVREAGEVVVTSAPGTGEPAERVPSHE